MVAFAFPSESTVCERSELWDVEPRITTIATATGSVLGSILSPQSRRSSISPSDLGPPPRTRTKKIMRMRTRIDPMKIRTVEFSPDSLREDPSSSSGMPSPSSSWSSKRVVDVPSGHWILSGCPSSSVSIQAQGSFGQASLLSKRPSLSSSGS